MPDLCCGRKLHMPIFFWKFQIQSKQLFIRKFHLSHLHICLPSYFCHPFFLIFTNTTKEIIAQQNTLEACQTELEGQEKHLSSVGKFVHQFSPNNLKTVDKLTTLPKHCHIKLHLKQTRYQLWVPLLMVILIIGYIHVPSRYLEIYGYGVIKIVDSSGT